MTVLFRGDFLQYNKVEICGVDTAKLRVLSEARKKELLEKMHSGTPAERRSAALRNNVSE